MYEELTPTHTSLARGNGSQHVQNVEFPNKVTAEMLRKDLESELKLDSSDIRSYAWYHGKLPRDVAEELAKHDGDFLIRESVSSPGEFVLTIRWNSSVLHFKINQTFLTQGALQAKAQYQFERESFDSIPALIMFHFGKSIPISLNTGAVIRRPVNRSVPLSFSDAKYSSLRRQPRSQNGSVKATISSQPVSYTHSTSLSSSSLSSESSSSNPDNSDPRLQARYQHRANMSPDHLQRHTTDPLPVLPPSVSPTAHMDYPRSPRSPMTGPASPVTRGSALRSSLPKPFPLNLPAQPQNSNDSMLMVSQTGQRPLSQVEVHMESHGKPVGRAGSEPQLSPTKTKAPVVDEVGPLLSMRGASIRGSQTRPDGSPGGAGVPPKPSRVPSFRRPVIRHRGSRSAENTPLANVENLQPSKLKKQGNVTATPSKSQPMKGGSLSEPNTPLTSQQLGDRHDKPDNKPLRSNVTRSNAEAVKSNPNHNQSRRSANVTSLLKGSDVGARRTSVNNGQQMSAFNMQQFNSLLLSVENKPVDITAMAEVKTLLLKTDPFKLARHMTAVDCKVCQVEKDGLQDIILPKGDQLRKDIMERFQCIAFWVAVCVLRGCPSHEERVEMLNVFIQVANELVHSLGNVFGFSALMAGLTCPQLCELRELWVSLQQRYTNNAVTMEKKLRPLLTFLDEGRGQINLVSSCIPHIMPIIRFYENPLPGIPHTSSNAKHPTVKQLSASEGDLLGSVASGGNETSEREWWQNLPDDSFDSLMAQLMAARTVLTSLSKFRTNAKSKLHDFETIPKLEEIFATEFHLRLLWGSKGAEVERTERYQKFDRVITLMAKRLSG
uniref:Breast cancer anti-estrogen resistance protein 3-like n=1 Tax=Phallusia mammillata TaxID=59560 RepID=A0A6F9D7P0_9ASCI|nr:breast cancer anti-estrogen resistance protein 3-like [Phallusia mammillata]